MTQQKKRAGGPLVEAALALEEEFEAVEALLASAQKLPLTSQKNLEKTAGVLTELSTVEERLQGKLSALLRALDGLRLSQEGTGEALQRRVQEFQARRATFDGLATRYAEIGQDAIRLNAAVQQMAGGAPAQGEGGAPAPSMGTIVDELARLIGVTEGIREDAQAADFADLAHQADALRQQLASAKNRVSLLVERAGEAPKA